MRSLKTAKMTGPFVMAFNYSPACFSKNKYRLIEVRTMIFLKNPNNIISSTNMYSKMAWSVRKQGGGKKSAIIMFVVSVIKYRFPAAKQSTPLLQLCLSGSHAIQNESIVVSRFIWGHFQSKAPTNADSFSASQDDRCYITTLKCLP